MFLSFCVSFFCVCVTSIYFKRIYFIFLLYSHPPLRPYKMTGLLPERLQYGLVCCCLPSLRKIATIFSETILSHVMPLQNDKSLLKPYKMGCCSCFLASHASRGLAPDCAGYTCEHLHFFCSPILPTK